MNKLKDLSIIKKNKALCVRSLIKKQRNILLQVSRVTSADIFNFYQSQFADKNVFARNVLRSLL